MSRTPEPAATLRRATADDADTIRDLVASDAIRNLVASAYGKYVPLIGRTPMPMLVDYAEAVMEHEVWVLDAGGALAGVIELVPHDDQLWVENVAIAPEQQGRGFGRRLLAHAEDEARRLHLPAVGLLTNERYVENIAMYTRYGYGETHREPHLGTDLVYFRKPVPPIPG